MELLDPAVPHSNVENAREDERTDHHRLPPCLAKEDSDTPDRQADGRHHQGEAGNCSGEIIAEEHREDPRPVWPEQSRLELEDPPALPEVQQVNQAVQDEKASRNVSEHFYEQDIGYRGLEARMKLI